MVKERKRREEGGRVKEHTGEVKDSMNLEEISNLVKKKKKIWNSINGLLWIYTFQTVYNYVVYDKDGDIFTDDLQHK